MSNTRKVDPVEAQRLYSVEKLSTIEIAKIMSCTPYAVKSNLHQLGVQMRGTAGCRTEKTLGFVPTKDFMLAAMAYFNQCASDAAKNYKVKYATWIDWLEKFDIPRQAPGKVLIGRPSHRRQEIPVDEAVSLSLQGHTYEEIAQTYGVSYGVVVRRMREAGHTAPWRRAKNPLFKTAQWHKRKVLQELNIISCEICRESRALDFCHIKPSKEGGPTEKDNCLVLCQTHHHCYDSGALTREEFAKVESKVRKAEQKYTWTNGFYGGW